MSNSLHDSINDKVTAFKDLVDEREIPVSEADPGSVNSFDSALRNLRRKGDMTSLRALLSNGTVLDPMLGGVVDDVDPTMDKAEEAASNNIAVEGEFNYYDEMNRNYSRGEIAKAILLRRDIQAERHNRFMQEKIAQNRKNFRVWVCAPGDDRPYEITMDKGGKVRIGRQPLTRDDYLLSKDRVDQPRKPGLFSRIANWFHHLRSPDTDIRSIREYKAARARLVEDARARDDTSTELRPMGKNRELESAVRTIMQRYAGHDLAAQSRCRQIWDWMAAQNDAEYLLLYFVKKPGVLTEYRKGEPASFRRVRDILQEGAAYEKNEELAGRGNKWLTHGEGEEIVRDNSSVLIDLNNADTFITPGNDEDQLKNDVDPLYDDPNTIQGKLKNLSEGVEDYEGRELGDEDHRNLAKAVYELKNNKELMWIPAYVAEQQNVAVMQQLYDVYKMAPDYFAHNLNHQIKTERLRIKANEVGPQQEDLHLSSQGIQPQGIQPQGIQYK